MAGTGGTRRFPRLRSVFTLISGGLLVGFLIWAIGVNERRIATVDHRNVADLAILVDGIEQWARTARALGETNVYKSGIEAGVRAIPGGVEKSLYHPDFDTIRIIYTRSPAGPCPETRSIVPADAAPAGLVVAGDATPRDTRTALLLDWDRRGRICYRTVLPLAPMLRLEKVSPQFSHLLILDGSGKVLTQIGGNSLPITDRSEVPKLELGLPEIAARFDARLKSSDKEAPRDAVAPIDTRIAGAEYRIYQRPFRLPAPAPAAPTAAPATPPGDYVALAVTPRSEVTRETRRVSRGVLTAFVLAFALLLCLMPILKLRLVGPVDGVAPIEAGAVVLGIVAAVWISVFAVGHSLLLVNSRAESADRAVRTATWIARATGDELHRILTQESRYYLLPSLVQHAATSSDDNAKIRTLVAPPKWKDGRLIFAQPDGGFLATERGEQLPGSRVISIRRGAGASPEVGQRGYFRRAMRGEVLPAPRPNWRTSIGCLSGGYTIDQVRSLPDGVAKAAFALPLERKGGKIGSFDCPAPTEPLAKPPGEVPAAFVGATVLRSLLAPVLSHGVGFMVVDTGDPERRALFHSIEGRAQVETLADTIEGPQAAARLQELAGRRPPECISRPPGKEAGAPLTFRAYYDGEARFFAAAPIPCTTWAVLTHVPLDQANGFAATATLWAIASYMAIALAVMFLFLIGWLRCGSGAWTWLWPNPARTEAYEHFAPALLQLTAASLAVLLLVLLFPAPPIPFWLILVTVLPGLAWLLLWVGAGASKRPKRIREAGGWGSDASAAVLSPRTERLYTRILVAMLTVVAAVPAAIQLYDSAQFRAGVADREGEAAETRAAEARRNSLLAVARSFDPNTPRAAPAPGPLSAISWDDGDYRIERRHARGETMTAMSRGFAFPYREATAVDPLPHPAEDRVPKSEGGRPVALLLSILLLALALAGLIWMAIRTTLSGLFGFGIPLEAVDQPPVPDWSWQAAPAQTLVVGASPSEQAVIRGDGEKNGPLVIDLVDETLTETPGHRPDEIESRNIVVENLELLLRDPPRRIRALRYLELLAARRRGKIGKLVVMTDLSPLERLLQRFERDSEVLEGAEDEKAHQQLEELKRHREDVRWSRLFAGFATYSHRRTSDPVSATAGEVLVAEAEGSGSLSFASDEEREHRKLMAQRVLEELRPLPAYVVECGLPETNIGNSRAEGTALTLKAPYPDAMVDHFTSVFIEYYQLIWSASSLAERLIMFHLAHGRLVNISRAYAVRTLVRRGLVVFDPVPRLFNRSFAQFVRNVEKPETLKRWRQDAPRGAWQIAQLPLLLLIPLGLLVLVMLARQSGQSAFALMPILVTAAPVLLQAIGVLRRPSGT